MGIAIAITSGKGGLGKTTLTAYLGIAFANEGKHTLLIDANYQLRNLDLLLGLENDVVYNYADIISEKYTKEEVILKHPDYEHLDFLTCPQTKSASSIDIKSFTTLIESLKKDYDYILIDSSSGLSEGFTHAISACDQTIVVSDLSLMSLRNTDQLLFYLKSKRIFQNYIVLNRLKPLGITCDSFATFADYTEIISDPIIGIYFEGTNFSDFANIAKRVMGEDIPLPNMDTKTEERTSLLKRIQNMFKK